MRRLARAVLVPAVALLVTSLAASGQAASPALSPPAVAREFRGVWVASVANIDWPSAPGLSSFEQQAELVAILDRARALNLNAIILQVRPAGDALYASRLEPWSAYLTGREGRAPEPSYDPLAFAVAEAHARGLELHAWFNPYRARHASATSPNAATHMSVTDPRLVRSYGKSLWMDPGEPKVVQRTLDVMLDVVKRYDVDGIHVDDYFYPYPENGADGQPMDFPDSASFAAYRKRGGTLARDDWRRRNVDQLMARIYAGTKQLKPWVQVGISPFGIWRPGNPPQIKGFDAYAKLYADARRWLHEGWLDYVTPQLYWPIGQMPQSYPVLLDWWMHENTRKRHVWPGHYTTRGAAPTGAWGLDEISNQVRASRAAGAGGDVHFSMRPLMPVVAPMPQVATAPAVAPARPDSARIDSALAVAPTPVAPVEPLFDRLKREVYAVPALAPATPWLEKRPMPQPTAVLATDSASREQVVTLTPAKGRAAAHWTVRVLALGQWRTFILPGAQRSIVVAPAGVAVQRVLVTAVDRLGIESVIVPATARRTSSRTPSPARRGTARR